MTTSKSNPRNFKLGTVIQTKNATYTVYKKYKNSLLCDVEGERQRFFIEFSMFNNRFFLADLLKVEEPEFEIV